MGFVVTVVILRTANFRFLIFSPFPFQNRGLTFQRLGNPAGIAAAIARIGPVRDARIPGWRRNLVNLVERVASRVLSGGGEFMVSTRYLSTKEIVRIRQALIGLDASLAGSRFR